MVHPGAIPSLRALAISTVKNPPWPLIVVLFGILLRLSRYIFDDSLYNDETSLSDNVLGRSFSGLLRPLSDSQAAPIAFLFSLKLTSFVFGPGEYALRLVPLLAGLVSMVLFYYLAKRVLDPVPALV